MLTRSLSPTLTVSAPAAVAKHLHRQHAIHLSSNVHEDGFGRDGNHFAFQRFLALRTAVLLLLEFGKDIGETNSSSGGRGASQT
jgi:hypothetical protein